MCQPANNDRELLEGLNLMFAQQAAHFMDLCDHITKSLADGSYLDPDWGTDFEIRLEQNLMHAEDAASGLIGAPIRAMVITEGEINE